PNLPSEDTNPWDFAGYYNQYFPDLVEKWRLGYHAEVASAILQQYPKYLVPTFCVDIVMTLEGSKDDKLISLAAALLEAEGDCGWTLWEIKNKVEELCEIWGENTHEAFQRVGRQLKVMPRAVIVTFTSTLFNPQHKLQSLTMVGILTASLMGLNHAPPLT
ncbi:MAG: hypothetical protein PHS86_11425, partial [Syntrophaceae bacterium]|nr:hypothetical protein [Syntrophaceae bacterium]